MSVLHSIPPVCDEKSRILILGSFPSVRSREVGFFYGHPQNRFWRVLSVVYGASVPKTVEEKIAFLRERRIALWDVVASCEIEGSSDASIKNAVPNEIERLLEIAPVERIFVNGGEAARLYERLVRPRVGREAIRLPSTSPANAAWSLERLAEAWRVLAEETEN